MVNLNNIQPYYSTKNAFGEKYYMQTNGLCTGVLIDNRKLLTSARCCPQAENYSGELIEGSLPFAPSFSVPGLLINAVKRNLTGEIEFGNFHQGFIRGILAI